MIAVVPWVQAAPPAEMAGVEPVDVLVTARRHRCDTSIAKRIVSDFEFSRRAEAWAGGVPVRVLAPKRSDIRCLARIIFRLADKGVRKVEFVTSDTPHR